MTTTADVEGSEKVVLASKRERRAGGFWGWHMLRLAIASAILVSFVAPPSAQVARLEVHPVPSITLKDSDFLAGRKEGQNVTLAGQLRIPKLGSDKLPAV